MFYIPYLSKFFRNSYDEIPAKGVPYHVTGPLIMPLRVGMSSEVYHPRALSASVHPIRLTKHKVSFSFAQSSLRPVVSMCFTDMVFGADSKRPAVKGSLWNRIGL